jgi:hypothetical protein
LIDSPKKQGSPLIQPAVPITLLSRLLEKYNVPAAPLTLLISSGKACRRTEEKFPKEMGKPPFPTCDL